MVWLESAIHFQERAQLVLLFDLPSPLILRLDAVFHAFPAEVLDVHIVRSLETTRGGGTLARKYRRDPLASRAFGLVIRVQHRPESSKHGCSRAVSFIADDQGHRLRRDETGIPGLHHVLSLAQLSQVAQALGILQRLVPFLGARQEYRDRLLRSDIHLNVAAVPGRVISQPRMIIRGVQPHALVIARQPIENSLLAERRPGESASQQKREYERHFGVSHSNSIETRRSFARNDSAR